MGKVQRSYDLVYDIHRRVQLQSGIDVPLSDAMYNECLILIQSQISIIAQEKGMIDFGLPIPIAETSNTLMPEYLRETTYDSMTLQNIIDHGEGKLNRIYYKPVEREKNVKTGWMHIRIKA